MVLSATFPAIIRSKRCRRRQRYELVNRGAQLTADAWRLQARLLKDLHGQDYDLASL